MSNGSTAVATRDETSQGGQSPVFANGEGFNTAQRIATALSKSSVVPKEYQNNLPNVLVAMEYANRIGASVLAVMQNLDVIHGRPSLRASFLIGTVNACGRFTPIRFRFQGEEGTDTWGCKAVAKDRESSEECVGPLITIALAKAEGWYGKVGSKWKTIPELMLMYRAGAWWSRVYCPELSLGLHTTDEMEDLVSPLAGRYEVAASAAAALDAPDAPAVIPGVPVGERTAEAEAASLQARVLQAREKELLSFDDEQAIEDALKAGDRATVRMWTQEISNRLEKAEPAQAAAGA